LSNLKEATYILYFSSTSKGLSLEREFKNKLYLTYDYCSKNSMEIATRKRIEHIFYFTILSDDLEKLLKVLGI